MPEERPDDPSHEAPDPAPAHEPAPPSPTATPEPAGPPGTLGTRPVPPPPRRRHEVKQHEGSIKETIISMMISLAMALVAKAYVVEAFVIPTGSMAPTLLGKHMEFRSRETGFQWTVNPWFEDGAGNPFPIQQHQGRAPVVTDPMTVSRVEFDSDSPGLRYDHGASVTDGPKPTRAGDRILVQKCLYEVFPPQRFDVVVFKNPENARINFIKRLVGLPDEQIWLADGDVFARSCTTDAGGDVTSTGAWRIQRKPARVQRSVWRTIYSSEYLPREPVSPATGLRWFHAPWNGKHWDTQDSRAYRTDSAGTTTLRWDTGRWPITDWEPYNDVRRTTHGPSPGQSAQFPVSDLRMRAIVTPDDDGLRLLATIRARGHLFQAAVENGAVVVRIRDGNGSWQELARKGFAGFRAGVPRRFEFWHVDQSLQVWIDGRRILQGLYDWDPGIRLYHSTGKDGRAYGRNDRSLAYPATYGEAAVGALEWTFEGTPLSLARVGLDRDLYYQPRNYARFSASDGPAALATHPDALVTLAPDQYFMLGDNSPSSKDGRLWDRVDRNVARQIDPDLGVVNRKLLLGKAFFVYFPAPETLDVLGVRLPVPDFGHMRFIK